MTLTIPTGELVGTLSDAIPFAFPKDDNPVLNVVRVVWDGVKFHTQSTDGRRIAWSTWDPDMPLADGDEPAEDDLFTRWGAEDDPWIAHLRLADVTELVKVFKLPAKLCWTPLHVDAVIDPETRIGRVTVERRAETGMSAHVMDFTTADPADYPDLPELLDIAESGHEPVGRIEYWATNLADFAKVRQHGPMQLRFGGDRRATCVSIGSRFRGAVAPHQPYEPMASATDDLDDKPVSDDQMELVSA